MSTYYRHVDILSTCRHLSTYRHLPTYRYLSTSLCIIDINRHVDLYRHVDIYRQVDIYIHIVVYRHVIDMSTSIDMSIICRHVDIYRHVDILPTCRHFTGISLFICMSTYYRHVDIYMHVDIYRHVSISSGYRTCRQEHSSVPNPHIEHAWSMTANKLNTYNYILVTRYQHAIDMSSTCRHAKIFRGVFLWALQIENWKIRGCLGQRYR